MSIEDIKHHVNALKALLDDPQPGLFTWNQFLAEHLKALHDGWEKSVSKAVTP